MNPFLDPELPAPAKVLSLVRLHHGLRSTDGRQIPVSVSMRGNHVAKSWRAGARLNHLEARRRRIDFDDIPPASLPVILELAAGTNFILVKEKLEGDAFLVQFPDSRESVVQGERIREIYDGVCVFLRRRTGAPSETGGGVAGTPGRPFFKRLASRAAALPLKRGLFHAVAANLATLGIALGMLYSHGAALRTFDTASILFSAVGVLLAGAATFGILRLRREMLTEPFSAAIVGCCFIPPFALAILTLAGWSAVPFLWIAGLITAAFVLSNRLGRTRSRIREIRGFVLVITFTGAAIGSWFLVALGLLHPALMAGSIVVGTCLVALVIESDALWQELRLAAVV